MFKKIDKNNFMTFCLSFLIAVLMWLFATAENDPMVYQKIENIPVSYINTEILDSKNLVVTDTNYSNVSIRVYGRSVSVNKINKSKISALLDLSDINSAGKYSLEVNIAGINDNIVITDISPKIINVTVEDVGQDSINAPIITSTGKLNDNNVVLSVQCNVEDISTKGAKSKLELIDKIVGSVDVTGRSKDFSDDVELSAVDANGNKIDGIVLNPSKVKVDVVMGISKEVEVIEKTSGKVKDGFYISNTTISPKKVTIAGKKSIIDKISKVYTKNIKITNATDSINTNVALDLANGVIIKNGVNNVNVKINIDPISQRSVDISSFTFVGLDSHHKAEVINDKVKVVFVGEQKQLDKINVGEVTGVVDVTGLSVGLHSLSVNIRTSSLPSGVSIHSVNNEVVEVKISEN